MYKTLLLGTEKEMKKIALIAWCITATSREMLFSSAIDGRRLVKLVLLQNQSKILRRRNLVVCNQGVGRLG